MAKTQPTNQSYLNPPHGPGKLTGGANDIYLPENPKLSGGVNTKRELLYKLLDKLLKDKVLLGETTYFDLFSL